MFDEVIMVLLTQNGFSGCASDAPHQGWARLVRLAGGGSFLSNNMNSIVKYYLTTSAIQCRRHGSNRLTNQPVHAPGAALLKLVYVFNYNLWRIGLPKWLLNLVLDKLSPKSLHKSSSGNNLKSEIWGVRDINLQMLVQNQSSGRNLLPSFRMLPSLNYWTVFKSYFYQNVLQWAACSCARGPGFTSF